MLGVHVGTLVHVAAAAAGLSAVLAASAAAFGAVKLLGAAYLIYSGCAASSRGPPRPRPGPSVSAPCAGRSSTGWS